MTVLDHVTDVTFKPEFAEVFLDQDVPDDLLMTAVKSCGGY